MKLSLLRVSKGKIGAQTESVYDSHCSSCSCAPAWIFQKTSLVRGTQTRLAQSGSSCRASYGQRHFAGHVCSSALIVSLGELARNSFSQICTLGQTNESDGLASAVIVQCIPRGELAPASTVAGQECLEGTPLMQGAVLEDISIVCSALS